MGSAIVRCSCLLALCFVANSSAVAEEPLNFIPNFSTVVSSPDIKEPLTIDRLTVAMNEAAHAMNVQQLARPQIVVLQLSPAEAQKLGLKMTTVLTNHGRRRPEMFYEVWIVGPDGLTDMVRGVETVYEAHYNLKYTDAERGKLVARVLKFVAGTINVKAFQQQRNQDQSR